MLKKNLVLFFIKNIYIIWDQYQKIQKKEKVEQYYNYLLIYLNKWVNNCKLKRENIKNYPKCENIFQTFLYDDLKIEQIKQKYKKQYEQYKRLRRLSDIKLDDMSFEEMFLPYDHFDLKLKYNNLKNISGEEILEKYIILFYLVPSEFFSFISKGIDYFKYTIFYKNMKKSFPTNEIFFKKLDEIFQPYKKKFVELHNFEVERIMESETINKNLSILKRNFR